MHTALLQRGWCNFSRNTSYSVWILSLQKHTALPQMKITLIQKDMFVLNTAFVGRYGDVVIMLKSSSIFCRIVFCWKDNVVAFIKGRVNTCDTSSSKYMLSSGHEHSFICSLSFNVNTVLKNIKIKKCTPTASALFICLYYVISIGVYMYTYVHIYIYTHTCVRVYLHTYVHIYIYIWYCIILYYFILFYNNDTIIYYYTIVLYDSLWG